VTTVVEFWEGVKGAEGQRPEILLILYLVTF
jgi:hypothetical protein